MAAVTGTNTEKIDALVQLFIEMKSSQAARNDTLDAKIDGLQRATDAKIDGLQRAMEGRFGELKAELDGQGVQLQAVKEYVSAVRTAALIAQWAAVVLVPVALTVLAFLYNASHDHTGRLDRIEWNVASTKSVTDELKWQRDRIIRLEAMQEKK